MSRGLGKKRGRPDPSHAPPPPITLPEAALRVRARGVRPGLTAVITVTGSSSNAGKTTLVETLVRAFVAQGIKTAALKITRTHEGTCPRENDACHVCDDLNLPYTLIRDPAILGMKGKDTGRYVAAGADPVRWLLVQPGRVPGAALAALDEFPDGHVLVAEGNSFRDAVDPCLTLMAIADTAPPKPSALGILDTVDAFVGTPEALAVFQEAAASRGSLAIPARPILRLADAASWVLARLGLNPVS